MDSVESLAEVFERNNNMSDGNDVVKGEGTQDTAHRHQSVSARVRRHVNGNFELRSVSKSYTLFMHGIH